MRKRRGRRRPARAERGIALLVVVATLALVVTVTSEFQFSSRVDLELAYNARDALQAEYNARSALQLRALLLRHSRKVQTAISALGLDKSMMPPIGQMLEMIPIDCGILGAVARPSDASVFDDAEDLPPMLRGECSATSESEHSKISINVLAKATGGSNKQVTTMLLGLLANPAFERHFEEDDRNGTHAESPIELVAAMTDWIDRDENESGNQVSDEDRHYTYLKDSYRAKNAPYDSLAELALVHGVDDELYDILAKHVTIHNDSTQIELATAPDERILFGLIMCARQGVGLQELLTHPGLAELIRLIMEMRMLGGPAFAVLKVQGLVSLIQQAGLDALIDINAVRKVFTDKQGSTWYTIHAQGRMGNASRRITAVFQASEGQFYHVRME